MKAIQFQIDRAITEIHTMIVDEVIEITGFDLCMDSDFPLLKDSLCYIYDHGDLIKADESSKEEKFI